VTLELFRIDDRLIHGQVVVGWGHPCDLSFFVLVDDAIADAAWEQELYRMGTPEGMEVRFETVAGAAAHLAEYRADPRCGMLLTADVETMARLVEQAPDIRAVTLGGLHHAPGRVQRLRFVFLSPDDEARLRALAARGVTVAAQDVPGSTPVPLDEVLAADGSA
jgi:mannose/fructose/N-acetylgalactosamine-specific phosphotransferase system component IIB